MVAQIDYAFITFGPSPYLEDAQQALAGVFEIGVNACGVDGHRLANGFVASGLAHEFERMNPVFTAGKSSLELLDIVACYVGIASPVSYPHVCFPGIDYWVGWSLVHFQQKTGCPYERVFESVPYQELQGMYYPLHEASESKFVDVLSARLADSRTTTRLALQRKNIGLSQAELAERSGVGLRSIQMYEQRNKDINHASAETLLRLAYVLKCPIPSLMER